MSNKLIILLSLLNLQWNYCVRLRQNSHACWSAPSIRPLHITPNNIFPNYKSIKMTTIACILVFFVDKKSLIKKNSSHTKNQLNGYRYNITGNINGRPVHTTRTYGPYGQKGIACNVFFRRGRTYGPFLRPVRTGSVYQPLLYSAVSNSINNILVTSIKDDEKQTNLPTNLCQICFTFLKFRLLITIFV